MNPQNDFGLHLIANFDQLVLLFEHIPNFKNSEIVRMYFDRGNTLECLRKSDWSNHFSTNLKVIFYLFDNEYEHDDVRANACHVEVEFVDIQEVTLTGFNYQNPIHDLVIVEAFNKRLKKNILNVSWGGAGHDVEFICEKVVYKAEK